MDRPNRGLIQCFPNNDPSQFIEAARTQMAGQSLHDNAVRLALTGKTTLAEVIRVVSQVED